MAKAAPVIEQGKGKSAFGNLPNHWIAVILLGVAVAVFFTGLGNPFIGDDMLQIVNSPPAHSIANIGTFFASGTWYSGSDNTLVGNYYRPLMICVYALLYTFFGPNPVFFHLTQLLLCVGCAFLVYKIFGRFLPAGITLWLALLFLVHPANSEVAFAIPKMQDSMFVLFGLSALWLLMRSTSLRSLILAAACLLLSMWSKETALLFVPMALLYLFWWDRKRLFPFLGLVMAVSLVYVLMKTNAVGLVPSTDLGPMPGLGLEQRLLNIPAMLAFYITKFVFPWSLASSYYWTYTNVTLTSFFLPLLVDLVAAGIVVGAGRYLNKVGNRTESRLFWFFAMWTAIGLAAHMQVVPLDFSVAESWLYFPMVGMLGMCGAAFSSFLPHLRLGRQSVTALALILLVCLGVRTAIRGTDWRDTFTLASSDVAASPGDFQDEITLAYDLIVMQQLPEATAHAQQSVDEFPTLRGYSVLGLSLYQQNQFAAAKQDFLKALTFPTQTKLYYPGIYEYLGSITIWYGDPTENRNFLVNDAIPKLPNDGYLWRDLAIVDENQTGNKAEAKTAIQTAAKLGAATQYYYDTIMAGGILQLPPGPAPITQ